VLSLPLVGDKNEIAAAGVARRIPVFPAGAAERRDVLAFMAGLPGDGDQVEAEASREFLLRER
jgi:hypothetical protein